MRLGMATQTGREMERAKTQNTDIKELILEGLDTGLALLTGTDMVQDPMERSLPLEKLVRADLDSTEVVQEEDIVVQEEDLVEDLPCCFWQMGI